MSIKVLIEKAYWHLFKVMPVEMILKKKWDEYYKVKKIILNGKFCLSDISMNCPSVKVDKTIWVYWDKGIQYAPAVVRKCRDSLKKNIPDGWNIIELNEDTYVKYVKLPDFIDKQLQKGEIYLANWSDILRTALLYFYGGIWVDSTCFITKSIPSTVLNEPFFMFSMSNILRFSPMMYESWFIKANKGNHVLGELLQKLLFYFYHKKNKKEYYYVWFDILSVLYDNDIRAKKLMNQIWFCDHHDAVLMHVHYGFAHDYSDKLWKQIMDKCFVQKLSYKYDPSLERVKSENLIQHFLNQ